MNKTHCIEIATFTLKPGVTDETLLTVEKKIRAGQIAQEPGYLGRELAKGEKEQEWLMILRFQTRQQMDGWMAKVKTVPEMREMGALIAIGSMTTLFFEGAEPK